MSLEPTRGTKEYIRQHTRVCVTGKLSRAILSCGPSLSSKRLRSLSLLLSVCMAGLGKVRGGGKEMNKEEVTRELG